MPSPKQLSATDRRSPFLGPNHDMARYKNRGPFSHPLSNKATAYLGWKKLVVVKELNEVIICGIDSVKYGFPKMDSSN